MIIHICGPSGSGKTTLGDKLAKKYKNIIVKDLDDLFHEFMKTNDIKYGAKFKCAKYQQYIYNFIKKQNDKLIVFVGLNLDMGHSSHYYDLQSQYKLYIKLPTNDVIKQKFDRGCIALFQDLHNTIDNNSIKQLEKNDKAIISDFQRKIVWTFNLSHIRKQTEEFNNDYKKFGYVFMTRDKIYEKCMSIIDNML